MTYRGVRWQASRRRWNSIPATLLTGIPEPDQAAIRAIFGKPVLLVGYDEMGRAELEFAAAGKHGTIWVDPDFIEPTP